MAISHYTATDISLPLRVLFPSFALLCICSRLRMTIILVFVGMLLCVCILRGGLGKGVSGRLLIGGCAVRGGERGGCSAGGA